MYVVTEKCLSMKDEIYQSGYICDNAELAAKIAKIFAEKRIDQLERKVIKSYSITCEGKEGTNE